MQRIHPFRPRRRWLLAVIIAGITVGLPGWGQADRIGLRHLYTVDRYSGSLRFLSPTAVFFDPGRQEIYLADAGKGTVVTLDRNGNYLGHFYHRRKGDAEKSEPAGLAVSGGTVFVADASAGRVLTYDYRGTPTGSLPMPDGTDGQVLPGKMAVDSAGNLYVTARNAGKVIAFGRDGRPKAEIGVSSASRIESCSDVAAGDDGRVYILSSKGTAVHVFDSAGKSLFEFGSHGPSSDEFSMPTGIDIDGKGRLWIADAVRQVVKVFRPDRALVANFGGLGTNEGAFFFPTDVCIDRVTNTLFVLEKNGRRLQAFAIEEK